MRDVDPLRTVIAALVRGCSPTTTAIAPEARLLALCPSYQDVGSLVGVALLFCDLPPIDAEAYWRAWAVLRQDLERVTTVADLARFYERAREVYAAAEASSPPPPAPPPATTGSLPDPEAPQRRFARGAPRRPAVGPGWTLGGARRRSKWFEADLWSASVEDSEGQLPAAQYVVLCDGAGGQGAGEVLTGRLLA